MNSKYGFISLMALFIPISSLTIVPNPDLDEHWRKYKMQYNRTYPRPRIDKFKRLSWEANYRKVQKHNEEHETGKHTYKLEVNHLADLSRRQYINRVKLTPRRPKSKTDEITTLTRRNLSAIPEELDWRQQGFITDSLSQDECGSCYAFSVASCIQGQYFITRGKIKKFSIQQLVDCSIIAGNLGCAGGSLRNSLKYIQSVGGIMLEQDYPYKGKQDFCKYRRAKTDARLKNWGILPPKDEHSLKAAVALIGPVAVSVNASPSTFQLYASGVYNDPECIPDYVNHAMLLVGYTKEAWILKNWWSEEWGDNGYMLLARGGNICAISNYAAFATIY